MDIGQVFLGLAEGVGKWQVEGGTELSEALKAYQSEGHGRD
jgi:hypothetical protein